MALSEAQFNKIALKTDLKKYATKNDLIVFKDEILSTLDKIIKIFHTTDEEKISNLSAHNRIQADVNDVRKKMKMKIKNPVL